MFIVSYGTIHEKLISKIFINNKSEAQGKRGYNVVVINERTGSPYSYLLSLCFGNFSNPPLFTLE